MIGVFVGSIGTRLRLPAAAMALLASGASALDLSDYFPSETHVAFWVDDLSDAKAAADKNGFAQLLLDEKYGVGSGSGAIDRTFGRIPVSDADPLMGVWRILLPAASDSIHGGVEGATSVMDFSAADVTKTFTDGFALYSTMYDLQMDKGTPIMEWDTILAAEYQPDQKDAVDRFVKKALADIPSSAMKQRVEYFGHELYHIEYYMESDATLPGDKKKADLGLIEEIPVIVEYGFVDGKLFMAEGRGKPLERALRPYSESGDSFRLKARASFQQAAATLDGGKASFHYYLDVAHHIRELQDWPDEADNVRLFTALGLKDAGPLLLNGTLNETGARLDASIVTQAEPQGIFSLLGDAPQTTYEGLKHVPMDAESFGVLSMNMSRLYDQARAAAAILSPGAQVGADAMISGISSVTSVDLKRDILDLSEGDLVSYLRPSSADDVAMAFIFPLRGGQDPVNAINAVIDKIAGPPYNALDVEASDFMGFKVWESPSGSVAPKGQRGLYLSATPGGVVVGSNGEQVRDGVRRLSGEGGDSILSDSKVAEFVSKLPQDGARGFVFTRGDALLKDYDAIERAAPELRKKLPPDDMLRSAIGDSWWTLRSKNGAILFTYMSEAPKSAN
ncbi:hypothetical protein BH09SUM1_BH09SUM1_27500 [soil metagenome]